MVQHKMLVSRMLTFIGNSVFYKHISYTKLFHNLQKFKLALTYIKSTVPGQVQQHKNISLKQQNVCLAK